MDPREQTDGGSSSIWEFGERQLKILWVKADKLLPIHNGGNIRSYHILRHLVLRHELTLLSYYGGDLDIEYGEELLRYFPGAVCLCTGKNRATSLGRGFDYLLRLRSKVPYAISRFTSTAVQIRLEEWFLERRFDVAVCDFLDAAVNFPDYLDIPTVLFQHNVESEIWRRHATAEANPVLRALYRVEFEKMLRYEQSAVGRFHHIAAVSGHDRKLMGAWVDPAKITVVPTGVDLEQYRPSLSGKEDARLVLFVGAMDWLPNVDAVEYFSREIWPSIHARVPVARFRIVGRNPVGRVRRLMSNSIEVTGSVPSVVEHLAEAAVVVVPLRIGGGTRLKIYEAMAAGKAVVSTSIGAEGLDVHPGDDILLADHAEAFAGAVVNLLEDVDLRQGYERAATALAAKYDWAVIANKFGAMLETVTQNVAQVETGDIQSAVEVHG